ncbi:MAG TPA: 16S rRNA (adenine(1518)-N(6)/adenine(1519)-N(6))-dimethyltransferase RsmA [Chitinophagaceae bacterium]|nr:16S rRNA (adenine(1518)-N(6)/adenine(1519)-N(6))-dimethyltransferase RsmA [Chitinophagaceae bacterium]
MYTLKKSLGQHFLKDEAVCERIIAALTEHSFSHLLEVGPGGGAITKYLYKLPGIEFKAVELDDEKIEYLEKTYPALRGKIIRGSILEIPRPFSGHFTVIGNFPYNISSQIMFRMIEWKDEVDEIIGMFQKEVAERIAAPPGNKDYGILSVLIQAWFRVEYLFDVDENSFNPPPKVKSGVIRMVNIGDPHNITDMRKFFLLVKTAFGQRRKQLRNPLKQFFTADVLQSEIFTKRAENLSVKDYVDLMKLMK